MFFTLFFIVNPPPIHNKQVGSVPLRGTFMLMAKEDRNGEPDPVSHVSEAVHSDGAHSV